MAETDEFCVVMTLKRKDGSSTDLKMYKEDDPEQIAEAYVRADLVSRACPSWQL